jgi:hypothetical protein
VIKQLTSKALKHPFISTLVAGVVVAIITPSLPSISYETILSAIYNFIAGVLSNVSAWFTQDITLQLWLVLLIGLLLLITIPLVMFIYESRGEQESESPFDYKQDSILGVNWKWDWLRASDNKLYVKKLTPLCPQCSNILDLAFGTGGIVTCSNLSCNWGYQNPTQRNNIPHNKRVNCSSDLTALAENEIIRRLNTKQYGNAPNKEQA